MQQSVLLLIEVKNMKNNKKYAVITFIVVGVFYVIMFIVTLIERNSNKIISPAETRDSSIYIIILACSPIVLMTFLCSEAKERSLQQKLIGTNTDLNILLILVTKFYFLKIIEE